MEATVGPDHKNGPGARLPAQHPLQRLVRDGQDALNIRPSDSVARPHARLIVLPQSAVERGEERVSKHMNSELETWFASAILPHQEALTRYLHRLCKSSSEVPDLRQETYFRVYESAKKSRPRFPRTFLFATARNLAIDRLRRERVVSIHYTQDALCLDRSIDELTPERSLSAREDLQKLTRAFDSLPDRTRSVIWLRRVAGLSQREAAASLGMDEGALEGHMVRGMRGLAKALECAATREKGSLDCAG
jgi:RNA polymerase sigma factor (sigma-70 family)